MKRSALFTSYEPPPGGLTRLRSRLNRAPRVTLWWAMPLGAALAAVLVLLVAGPPGRMTVERSPATLALGLAPVEADSLFDSSLPVVRLSAPSSPTAIYAVVGR